MVSTLGTYIKARLSALKMKQYELAESMDVSNNAVSKWIKTGKISRENFFELVALLGSEGAPYLDDVMESIDSKRLLPSSNTDSSLLLAYSKQTSDEIEIRQFDTGGSMGVGVLLRDQPGVIQSWRVSHEWLDKNVRSHTGADNLCIVTGFGDSMRGMFEPGDPLIVDTGVRSVDFDAIYFFRVGGEGFIKRLQRIPGEGIRAISENKAYESWTIKPDMDFEVFGRVLKAWRSEDY